MRIRRMIMLAGFALLATFIAWAAAADSSSSSSKSSGNTSNSPTQARQSAASIISTIGSLIPGLITNVAPLMLLFGLGALIMPALGTSAMGLLRESRRSSNEQTNPAFQTGAAFPFSQYARPLQTSPQDFYYFTKRSLPGLFSNFNSAGLTRGLQDILERVVQAIENADKRYN